MRPLSFLSESYSDSDIFKTGQVGPKCLHFWTKSILGDRFLSKYSGNKSAFDVNILKNPGNPSQLLAIIDKAHYSTNSKNRPADQCLQVC